MPSGEIVRRSGGTAYRRAIAPPGSRMTNPNDRPHAKRKEDSPQSTPRTQRTNDLTVVRLVLGDLGALSKARGSAPSMGKSNDRPHAKREIARRAAQTASDRPLPADGPERSTPCPAGPEPSRQQPKGRYRPLPNGPMPEEAAKKATCLIRYTMSKIDPARPESTGSNIIATFGTRCQANRRHSQPTSRAPR